MYDLGFSKCEMGTKVWGLMGVAYPRFLGFEGGGLTGLGGVPGLSLFLDACVKRTGKIKYLYCLLLKFNESCEKQIIKCTQ